MNSGELKKAIKAGDFVFGTLIVSPSPLWAEIIKKIKLDFVFIDTEHIPLSRNEVSFMCQIYKALNIAPIVRIPSPDPYAACMALDGGASGIVAPYIESVEEVKSLCGAVKWRPLKGRFLKELLEGERKLDQPTEDYLIKNNNDKLLIINIESVPAMENLDQILAVPGVDAIQVGPHDLSISLGIPEQYSHPKFLKAMRFISEKGKAAGIGVGNHFSSGIVPQIDWAREGFNIIINSSDINSFYQTITKEITAIKEALGIDINKTKDSFQI